MSAVTPNGDIHWRDPHVRFVPEADIRKAGRAKKKNRLAAVSPKFNQYFDVRWSSAPGLLF
jgi:hypothetical protein